MKILYCLFGCDAFYCCVHVHVAYLQRKTRPPPRWISTPDGRSIFLWNDSKCLSDYIETHPRKE